MISAAIAKAQFARLSAMPGFNDRYRDPEFGTAAMNEMVAAIRSAATEDDAKAAITEWVSKERFLPSPADVRSLLADPGGAMDEIQAHLDANFDRWKREYVPPTKAELEDFEASMRTAINRFKGEI